MRPRMSRVASPWKAHPVTNAAFRRFVVDTGHVTVAERAPDAADFPDAEPELLVPGSQVHATRIKLMGKGVAMRGGVGFEIFNNNDFGMTEFAQKINYHRALQGELTRTIAALDEVRNVRVHLVMPESGLFRKSAVRPKAGELRR